MSNGSVSSAAILLALLTCACSKSSVPPGESGETAAPRARAASQPRGTATLRGRVATIAGEPLGGAEVLAAAHSPGRSFGPILSGADGWFEFRDLPAGRYQVLARKKEFLPWRYRQVATDDRDIAEVDVADGQMVDDIEVALPRGAVVTGRVVDRDSQPLADARVILVQRHFEPGRVDLVPLSTVPGHGEGFAATTNERGEYRLFGVPPGDYLVLTTPRAPRETARTNAEGVRIADADTFYPSATRASDAALLSLGFGDVRHDITIKRATVPLFEIRGSVVDKTGRRASSGRVQVMSRGERSSGRFAFGPEAESRIQPSGDFVLTDVRPGRYTVRALLDEPEPAKGSFVDRRISHYESSAGVAVDVTNGNVADLRIAASGLVRVRGHVVFEDRAAARSIAPAVVCTTPRVWDADDAWLGIGTLPATPGTREMDFKGNVGLDYQFEWMTMAGHIGADAHHCREHLPDPRTWHVKAILANGRDVTDSGFDVDPIHPPELQILLTNRQPRLTGVVTDASGSPRAKRVVILFARDRTRWAIPHGRYVQVTFTDDSGRYRATVPAGEYFVAATARGYMGVWMDPDFLASLVPHAQRVSLPEGERMSLNLSVAPLPVPHLR